jgi:hypothetical protein
LGEAEGAELAEFEVGEKQRSAVLEGGGGSVMQVAQRHKGDQGDVDLDTYGVFAAPEKAGDLEVLLEP